jgi:TRAP-type C4-dicarboxylate transport system permease small subunit
VRVLAQASVGLFGVAMTIWGSELVALTWEHVIPTLGLPRGIAYVPIPLAGILILGFTIEQIAAELRDEPVTPQWS